MHAHAVSTILSRRIKASQMLEASSTNPFHLFNEIVLRDKNHNNLFYSQHEAKNIYKVEGSGQFFLPLTGQIDLA